MVAGTSRILFHTTTLLCLYTQQIGRALQIVNGQQQAGDGRWQGPVSRNLRAVVDNLGGTTSRGALRGSKYLLCGAHIALPHHRANVAAKCGHPRRVSTDRGWPGCPQLGTSPTACVSNADSPWSGNHPRTCGSAGGRSLCRRRAVAVGAGHGVQPRTHWGNPLCIHRGPTRALAANTARESNGVGENAGGRSTTTQGVNPASRTGRRPTRSYPCGNGVWRRGCTGIGLPSPSAATAWERCQGQLSFSPTGSTARAHDQGVGPGCGTQQGSVQGGPGNCSGTFPWGAGYYSCTSSAAPLAVQCRPGPAWYYAGPTTIALQSAARWGWSTRAAMAAIWQIDEPRQ